MFEYFIISNLHFAVSVFSSLVFFAGGWLYLDSSRTNGSKSSMVRGVAFFILTLAYALHATHLEAPFILLGIQLGKIAGLFLILVSLVMEPILRPPSEKKRIKLLKQWP